MTVKEKAQKMREQGIQIMTAKEKVEFDDTMKRIQAEKDKEMLLQDILKRLENIENEIIAYRRRKEETQRNNKDYYEALIRSLGE